MNSKHFLFTLAIAVVFVSFLIFAHHNIRETPPGEFGAEKLIAAGERGGPLTPTSDNFSSEDNHSFGLAMADWNAHRYDEAVEKLKGHLEKHPRSPWAAEAQMHVACYNYYKGHYETAEESFLNLVDKYKEGQIYRKALIRLGLIYAESSRYEEGFDYFKRCLDAQPTWQQKTLCRAWLMKLGRLKNLQWRSANCGSLALKRVFEKKGIPFPEELLQEESSSLFDIARMAKEQDVEAVGVNLSYDDLIALDDPCIIPVEPTHFLVVEKVDSRNVFTLDPQGGRKIYRRERFLHMWDGAALLFDPIETPKGNLLSEEEMKTIVGGCCGLPQLSDDLGGTPNDLPIGDACGGGSGNFGSPSLSLNPKSLNLIIGDIPIGYRPARGPEVTFHIVYNSQDPQDATGGAGGHNYYPVGNKWSLSFNSFYLLDPSDNVTVVMPDGKRDLYTRNAPPDEDTFTPPPRVYHTLVENPDGSYTLTLKRSRTRYHYDTTHQALSSIVDRWGNTVTLTRDANGYLTSVSDAVGRVTTVTNNGDGTIDEIEDPIGRTASFSYDGDGNLTSVTDMGGYAYSYTYDADSYLLSLTRPTGTWTFTHAFPDHIEEYPPVTYTWETYKITVTDPLLQDEVYYWKAFYGTPTYPGNGMYKGPTEFTDKNGNVTHYFFTSDSNEYLNLITKGDPEPPFWVKGYKYRAFSYDVEGNRTEVKIAEDNCWVPTDPPPVDDCPYRATSYTYDNGNITSRTDPGSHQTVYTWDADDNLTAITDPMNKTITLTYDSYGNITSVIPPAPFDDDTMDYTYKADGQVETITNARAYTTTCNYDGTGRLTQIDFPDGTTMGFGYDGVDRLTSVTYPTGLALSYTYDDLDRVTRVDYPDTTYEEYSYGCCGIESALDRAGKTTIYEYDDLSRLTLVTDPAGNQTEYTYDPKGNVTMIRATRDASLQTVVEYDYYTPDDIPAYSNHHLNRLESITFPGGKTRTFTYYWNGDPMNMVNETGQYFWYYHDDEGRLTRLDLPGTEDMTYTYNDNDRVTSITYVIPGGTGLPSDVTSFAYDELERVTSVDGPDAADTVSYTHNEVGNRATMSVNGITTTYAYNEMNRLLSVTSPYASASYVYSNGLLDTITYSNGDTVEYGYDALDRLSSLVNKNSAESVLASYSYSYGLPTAITAVTGGEDGLVDSYQYDDIYRLTRETRHYESNVIESMRRFSYDEVGNRTRYADNGRVTTATFTQDNQIVERSIGEVVDVMGRAKTEDWDVTVNGVAATVEADGTFIAEGLILPEGPNTLTAEGENPETMETDTHEITVTKLPQEDVTYTFDDRGNMTGKTDATGTTDYFWFYTDRLKRIEFPDASRHRYYYDGLGRRVLSKEDGRDDRRFAYDGWNVIGEKTEGGEDFVAYYTRGADMGGGIGGIISVHRNGTPAQYPDGYHTGDYFYHYNHRGDVVSVTDSTGAEVGHYRYDAYGNVVEKTGDFESP